MILPLLQLDAAVTGPSFDCGRARSEVERAICASSELSALDREEARLSRMALNAPPAQRKQLLARQRQFLKDRNGCVQSAAPLEECVRDAYLGDIADLRRLARLEGDAGGLSSGPIRFRCDGGYPDIFVTLFRLTPAQGYITVPTLNEGQPLVASPETGNRLVGRYSTGMLFDADARRVRLNARICDPKPAAGR